MRSIENQEQLDDLLEQAEIKTGISIAAEEMKEEVHESLRGQIDNKPAIRIIFRRMAIVAASSVAVFFTILYINDYPLYKKQMLARVESNIDMENVTEVSIVSGKIRKEIANGNEITNTKKGDILIGGVQAISTDDLVEDNISIVIPKGKRAFVQLCEGTKIWLNSGSKLLYPKDFGWRSRNIYIDGEMYIEVSRNEKKPFHVHTNLMTINVLGTKFSINTYKNEAVNHVVLTEGSIEVERGENTIQLTPGQGYFINGVTEQVKKADVYSYTCWKDGKMKLIDETFDVLIEKLSRYYGVKVEMDTALNSLRFDGNLNLGNSIEEVISILSLSHNFQFKKRDGVIEINVKQVK